MSTHLWRPSDLEAIRVALAIPVSPAAIRAINDEMAALERHYPEAIAGARAHLDAIALLDQAAMPAATTEPPPPRIRKVTRKGAAGPVPLELPKRRLDVIEYATELLMEEVCTEYELPPVAPAAAQLGSNAQRQRHADALLLVLPRLSNWQQPQRPRFGGQLIRG
jgi:hypothetical protein